MPRTSHRSACFRGSPSGPEPKGPLNVEPRGCATYLEPGDRPFRRAVVASASAGARAFVHEPELLLLDDPSTGLRGDTCAKLIKIIDMKKTSGCLKHTIVASDDEVFMKKLNAKTIDMNELQIKSNKQVSVA